MNHIYSRSEDNLEVFTTVMSPKLCRSARGRPRHPPQIRRESVAAVSDCTPYWPTELLPCPSELIDILYKDDEVWRFGRLQNGQKVLFPVKCPTKQREMAERRTGKLIGSQSDEHSALPKQAETSSANHGSVTQQAAAQRTPADSPVREQNSQILHRNTTEDQAQPEGTDASLLIAGRSASCGTTNILRKLWMKHKKRAAYLGAMNGAFEAD
ncbi:vexin isoform X2 [Ambystoma mexicanum]|uniref:vexin isoform X2 n=1 Tax=Ambystoma mexicanum TaxID=8296 RepID=UPI0037E79D30